MFVNKCESLNEDSLYGVEVYIWLGGGIVKQLYV